MFDDDSPWGDDGSEINNDWDKMAAEFTNAGYREGITAGKESALQEGFDAGFAQIGVPIGRNVGILRGIASGLLSFIVSSGSNDRDVLSTEIRQIHSQLANIRISDVAPRDLDAEEHARQHLEEEEQDLAIEDENLNEKRKMERLEDMLSGLSATPDAVESPARPTLADLQNLEARLTAVSSQLGFQLNWTRENYPLPARTLQQPN